MDLAFLFDNKNEIRKILIKKRRNENFYYINEYDDDFQIMFHEILNEMTFHEKVFSNFISIHLQDVVKTFPNVLTSKPELTHT